MPVTIQEVQAALQDLRDARSVQDETDLDEFNKGQIDGAMVALLWVLGGGVSPIRHMLGTERWQVVRRFVQHKRAG